MVTMFGASDVGPIPAWPIRTPKAAKALISLRPKRNVLLLLCFMIKFWLSYFVIDDKAKFGSVSQRVLMGGTIFTIPLLPLAIDLYIFEFSP
jgi:hypothetical protein